MRRKKPRKMKLKYLSDERLDLRKSNGARLFLKPYVIEEWRMTKLQSFYFCGNDFSNFDAFYFRNIRRNLEWGNIIEKKNKLTMKK